MNIEDIRLSELIKPTPKQRQCIESTDGYRFTLYGGAAGGGKSYLLRWWCLRQLLVRYAQTGITGLTAGLFSADYPTLQDRQISKIAQEFPEDLGQVRRTEKEGFNFFIKPEFGGGRIALRNLADPSSYKSAEFCDIAIEELSENLRGVFEDLVVFRLRIGGDPELKKLMRPPCFLGATNPTGRGLHWIKSLWIDRKFPKELEHLKQEFNYVPALLQDNPHLGADYAEALKGLPDRKRRALLEGDWSIPEGQYFTNFERADRAVHPSVVAQLQRDWWPRWISQDWGFKHHSPVHWHTVGDVMPEQAHLLGRKWDTPRKCVFTYREHVVSLSETGQSEEEWARQIVLMTGTETIKRYFLSSDAFGQKTSANTPADMIGRIFRASRLPMPERANMAPGSRSVGWRFMYQLIQSDSWFISELCPLALDAIPALEYDTRPGHDEDILKTDNIYDDIGDELRYGLQDMLNSGKQPFSEILQEKVIRVARESGLTAANIVRLRMEHERRGKERWTGR